jgi:putative ABC transport system permease protein
VIKLKISDQTDPIVAAKAVSDLFKLRHGEADDYQLVILTALLA